MKMRSPVLEELRRMIAEKGKITFEEFMDTVLYHPEYGYYTSRRTRIGKEGDYYTSTDVHNAFGACIMRQLEEIKALLDISPLAFVEVGAGKGLLCADILLSARDKSPQLFKEINYFIVEKSPDFIERQKKEIGELRLLDKVSWVSDLKEAIPDGIGIIYSNELIDAFPVHKVRYSNGRWQEIYVALDNGTIVEEEGILSSLRLSDFLDYAFCNQQSAIEDGYTTEVNLRAIDWIRGVGHLLKKGLVITIDYGYQRRELYSPERNRGTLISYHRHHASEDIYANIGEQDITSHTDFTSLAEGGQAAALEVTGFTDQSYFLMGCGIEEEFRQIDSIGEKTIEAFTRNIALKKLLMPGGMGSIFKVLIQHKGMERPRLRGLGFGEIKMAVSLEFPKGV